jgi:NhaA family Na+:H+ antiporter
MEPMGVPGSLVGVRSADPLEHPMTSELGGRRTFVDSDRALARYVARPVQQFLHVEAGGGIALVAMAILALVWANSPFRAGYQSVFHTEVALQVGSHRLAEDLTHWINDALMAVFFFVVGLEIKREWVAGELRDRRAAALPALAAVGGMIVPAGIYLVINAGSSGARGWGIPMATDIAFALGVVAVLGRRVPPPLKVFLLTLAIVDDIGAILVIACFYAGSVRFGWLAAAALIVLAVWALRQLEVVHPPAYVLLGAALWLTIYESGVHATIAGVIMGLLAPAVAFNTPSETEAVGDALATAPDLGAADAAQASFLVRSSVPVTDRLLTLLHPWTSYLIVPLFALANAGIEIRRDSLSSGSTVLVGVVVGLAAGKVIGVAGASWLATRFGIARLPTGVSWGQLMGVAALAGIGFTVSLFVAGLAFEHGPLQADAKIGILLASLVAALAGSIILVITSRNAAADDPER